MAVDPSLRGRRFSRPDRAMREKVARLNWAALVGAGVVAGASMGGTVRQIRSAFDALEHPGVRWNQEGIPNSPVL
jgi:hypothetical protein